MLCADALPSQSPDGPSGRVTNKLNGVATKTLGTEAVSLIPELRSQCCQQNTVYVGTWYSEEA